MKIKIAGLALTVFVSTLATSHAAQYFLGKLEDGPHIGVVTGGDTEDTAIALGYQVQYNLNSYWSWDVGITHHQDDLKVSPPGVSDATVDTDFYKVHGSLRLNLLAMDHLNAYTGAGIHYMIHREKLKAGALPGPITAVQAELKDDIGLHGVLGLEWLINEDWELFLEGQYAAFETDLVLDVTTATTTTEVREEVPYDHITVRLGLNFRF